MRVFLALDLDEVIRAAAIDWRARIMAGLGAAHAGAVGWTTPERLHVTLHFFGEITPDQAAAAGAALGDGRLGSAIPAALGRGGVFPEDRRPRVIWVDFDRGRRQIVDLQAACVSRLRSLMPLDPQVRFSPHVTIGRVRRETRGLGRRLQALLTREEPRAAQGVLATVTLYESRLTSGGPIYSPLNRIPLPGGE